jgi:hypothetical protein
MKPLDLEGDFCRAENTPESPLPAVAAQWVRARLRYAAIFRYYHRFFYVSFALFSLCAKVPATSRSELDIAGGSVPANFIAGAASFEVRFLRPLSYSAPRETGAE